MAATQREMCVGRNINQVWEFVSDMGNWASQMPGYVSHETLNEDDSAWTLNVDLGPFQRPIVVDVHVNRWDAPDEVDFEVKGHYEPFSGGGTYRAERAGGNTKISLAFHAEPSGSMAKMIGPLVGPVLEGIADQFCGNLAEALGGKVDAEAPARPAEPAQETSRIKRVVQRLADLLRSLTGRPRRT